VVLLAEIFLACLPNPPSKILISLTVACKSSSVLEFESMHDSMWPKCQQTHRRCVPIQTKIGGATTGIYQVAFNTSFLHLQIGSGITAHVLQPTKNKG
jgi:hypothetical protein